MIYPRIQANHRDLTTKRAPSRLSADSPKQSNSITPLEIVGPIPATRPRPSHNGAFFDRWSAYYSTWDHRPLSTNSSDLLWNSTYSQADIR